MATAAQVLGDNHYLNLNMTSRKFRLIIILIAASLVALIGVQLFWINHAIRLREQQFNVQVSEAMKEATAKIESQATCFETFSTIMLKKNEGLYMIRQKTDGNEKFLSPVFTEDHHVKNLDTIPMN